MQYTSLQCFILIINDLNYILQYTYYFYKNSKFKMYYGYPNFLIGKEENFALPIVLISKYHIIIIYITYEWPTTNSTTY